MTTKIEKDLEELEKKERVKKNQIEKKKKIKNLEKKIKEKKYGDLKRVGSNIKNIGKNLGKEFEKFVTGQDSKKKPKKIKSVEEVIKDLPQ